MENTCGANGTAKEDRSELSIIKEFFEEIISGLNKQMEKLRKDLAGMRVSMEKANDRADAAEVRALAAEVQLKGAALDRESRKRERKLSKRREKSAMSGGVAKATAAIARGVVSDATKMVDSSSIVLANRFSALSDEDESDKSTGLHLENAKKRTCNNERVNFATQAINGGERKIRRTATRERDCGDENNPSRKADCKVQL